VALFESFLPLDSAASTAIKGRPNPQLAGDIHTENRPGASLSTDTNLMRYPLGMPGNLVGVTEKNTIEHSKLELSERRNFVRKFYILPIYIFKGNKNI
jgi:hypothetical protein